MTLQRILGNIINLVDNAESTKLEDDIYEKLTKYSNELDDFQTEQNRRMGYKWYALIIVAVLIWIISQFIVLPAISFLFLSNRSSGVLEKHLSFIPDDLSIQDIAADTDAYILAWDINGRSPRFFSKWSQKELPKHDMPFKKMVLASAATPLYFTPTEIDDDFYISGENVALSPAMFAYYYAVEKKGINQNDIKVVSIGATNELAEKIDINASLLEWAYRLTTLNAPVKKHTQDYMLEHLLARNGQKLHKFELDRTKQQEDVLYMTTNRLPQIKEMSADLINAHRNEVEEMLTELVDERFENQCV